MSAIIPPEIPPIPEQLLTAVEQGKLVVFIGEGVSRLLGGVSWEGFSTALLEKLVELELLSPALMQQLQQPQIGLRQRISIAIDVFEANGIRPDLQSIFNIDEAVTHPNIYDDLYSLNVPFLTTNYDRWLDVLARRARPVAPSATAAEAPEAEADRPAATMQPDSRVYFRRNELTIEKLNQPGVVLHLHGSVEEPETMVVTTRQYLDHYSDQLIRDFLETLFVSYTVLFVGYNLSEDEILEYVFRRRGGNLPREQRHFRLIASAEDQVELFVHLRRYNLEHCGVELIPFNGGHAQLIAVVREWTPVLLRAARPPEFLEKKRVIDAALEDEA